MLSYQLLRLCAYGSFFGFSGNKDGKAPDAWLPMYFDHDDESNIGPSDDEIQELQELMKAINEKKG